MLIKIVLCGLPFAVSFANVVNFSKSRVFGRQIRNPVNYTSFVQKPRKSPKNGQIVNEREHLGLRGRMVVRCRRQFPFRIYP